MTLGAKAPGYSAFKRDKCQGQFGPRGCVSLEDKSAMAHPARVKSKGLNGVPHLPFQEFTASSLDVLLSLLKKSRVKGSEIEVSSSEESQHTTCSKPLFHVLVTTPKDTGNGEYKDLQALYQYCPECHLAVRVL